MKRWKIIKVEVERNIRDSRHESWKIKDSKRDWDLLPDKVEVVGTLKDIEKKRNLIGNLTDPSMHTLNEQKRSLGIVKPEIIRTYFGKNPQFGKWKQLGLPGMTDLENYLTKKEYEEEPRVKYRCIELDPPSEHDQQVLEWGFYEWFRKNPDNREQVWENAGIGKENTDIYFLLGNHSAHWNSFMIISVFRFPSGSITKSIFPLKKWTPREED
jgi:hypothetical protein